MALAFIDTSVIAYSLYAAPQQPACSALLEHVVEGRLPAVTSVLVIEEVMHLELRGRPPLPRGTARAAMDLFPVLLDLRAEHLDIAMTLDRPALGSADRLHAAVALLAGCDVIVTTDTDFDGVPGLTRVDPDDHGAVRRLLG